MSTPKPFIAPTIGRVVWFYPFAKSGESGFVTHIIGIEAAGTEQPYAAIVAHVWSDSMVNLTVFDANGNAHSRTSVELLQEATAERVVSGGFCTWMPFQKGQAARQEAAAPVVMVGLPLRDDMTGAADAVCAAAGYAPPRCDFGDAIRHLKAGRRVARAGWNGKGMWLALSCDGSREVPAANFWAPANRKWAEQQPNGTAMVLPSITMKTATGEILMGWLASQTDMLADDWAVVS